MGFVVRRNRIGCSMSQAKRLLAACYRGHGMESHAWQLEHERHLVAGPTLIRTVHAATRIKFWPPHGPWAFLLEQFGRLPLYAIRYESIPPIIDALIAAQTYRAHGEAGIMRAGYKTRPITRGVHDYAHTVPVLCDRGLLPCNRSHNPGTSPSGADYVELAPCLTKQGW